MSPGDMLLSVWTLVVVVGLCAMRLPGLAVVTVVVAAAIVLVGCGGGVGHDIVKTATLGVRG